MSGAPEIRDGSGDRAFGVGAWALGVAIWAGAAGISFAGGHHALAIAEAFTAFAGVLFTASRAGRP